MLKAKQKPIVRRIAHREILDDAAIEQWPRRGIRQGERSAGIIIRDGNSTSLSRWRAIAESCRTEA